MGILCVIAIRTCSVSTLTPEYQPLLHQNTSHQCVCCSAGNPFAAFADAAAMRIDSYQGKASERTVSDLLSETMASSLHRSASQGALDGRSTSLQRTQEADPPEVREGSNSVPVNALEFVKSKGMQMPDRSALQSSIARYASGMKTRMSQVALPTGADAQQLPSLWSVKAPKSPMGSLVTPRTQLKSILHGALSSLLCGHKGPRDLKRGTAPAALLSRPPLTKQNSLASIASNMKAASGEALRDARSRQNITEQPEQQQSLPKQNASASRQSVQVSAFSQAGLSISRDSSNCGFNCFGSVAGSPAFSDATGSRAGDTLPFAAATLQRPPVIDMSGAISRRTSDSSASSSTRVSLSGSGAPQRWSNSVAWRTSADNKAPSTRVSLSRGGPPQPRMARSRSSPAPMPAGHRAEEPAVGVPRRRTLLGEDDGGFKRLLHVGFHDRQALTPIRSGEVESFKRPTQPWQPLKSAFGDALLETTSDAGTWPSNSERSTGCPSPASRSNRLSDAAGKVAREKISSSDGALEQIKRMCSSPLIGSMLGRLASAITPLSRRPRGLSDTQAKPESASGTPQRFKATDLEAGFSAPASLHEACDAAIAALGKQQPPPPPKSMLRKSAPDFIFVKKGRQSPHALLIGQSQAPNTAPEGASKTPGTGNGAQMKGSEGLLSRAALREALGATQNAFASARDNESFTSLLSDSYTAFQQADLEAPQVGQPLLALV